MRHLGQTRNVRVSAAPHDAFPCRVRALCWRAWCLCDLSNSSGYCLQAATSQTSMQGHVCLPRTPRMLKLSCCCC